MGGIDIDPAALSRPDAIATATPAALSLSKANGAPPPITTKNAKAANTIQRIDLEPLYSSLKAAIGDQWERYKQALSLFMLGE
jgi:transcriptional coactivator HFI1/ADA1